MDKQTEFDLEQEAKLWLEAEQKRVYKSLEGASYACSCPSAYRAYKAAHNRALELVMEELEREFNSALVIAKPEELGRAIYRVEMLRAGFEEILGRLKGE